MRRLRTIAERLMVAGLAVAAIGLLATSLFDSSFWGWDARREALAAAGDPVSIVDFPQMKVPDAENAAAILRAVDTDVQSLQTDLGPLYASPEWRNGRITTSHLALLGLLDRYPAIWDAASRAAAAPGYEPGFPLRNGPSDFMRAASEWNSCRSRLFGLWMLRVDQLRLQSRHQEAFQFCLALIHLHRRFFDDPTMFCYLSNVRQLQTIVDESSQLLRSWTPSAAESQQFDTLLAQFDSWDRYLWALKSDRAEALDLQSTLNLRDMLCSRDCIENIELLIDFNAGLESLEAEINEVEQFATSGESTAAVNPTSGMYAGITNCHRDLLAKVRALRILNRLVQQRESSSAPANLENLGLSAAEIADPHGQGPLRLTDTPEGLVIYSIGRNRQDDGGDPAEGRDVGVWPDEGN